MNEHDEMTANETDDIKTENASDTQETISESTVKETPEENVESLRSEIDRLRAELEESRAANQKIADDISEFHRLFPNIELNALPDEVHESVRAGIPLSASYALYEKRLAAERERIDAINRQNARKSSGAAGKNTPKEYFSPEEVRSMSQSEVRENYKKIIDSMKKWN
ncbi:MAG: hypothetical protein E7670_08040 [Ruminococcaceae bacterium]|nr:hypothetical protein [Oscillospiraceae bacterium]